MAKKKPVQEMTTEELAKHVFPRKLHTRLRQIVGKSAPKSSSRKKDTK